MSRAPFPGAVAIDHALAPDGRQVSVDDAVPGEEYRCPFCAERGESHPVTPKQGDEKSWHFAHKEPNTTCLEHRRRLAREERERRRVQDRLRTNAPHAHLAPPATPPVSLAPPSRQDLAIVRGLQDAPRGVWSSQERPSPIPDRIAFYTDFTFADGHVERYLILREPKPEHEQLVLYACSGTRSSVGLDCYPLASSAEWERIAAIGDARDRVRQELAQMKRDLGLRAVFLYATELPSRTEPLELLLARPPRGKPQP